MNYFHKCERCGKECGYMYNLPICCNCLVKDGKTLFSRCPYCIARGYPDE